MSILPHVIVWARAGQTYWFADHDDFSVYALMGSQAYHEHPWRLANPVRAEESGTYFSSLECAPGVVLAKWLDLGPLRINLAWRALGGLAAGLLWYALLRSYVASRLVAAGLTLLLLTDGGLLAGQLIYAHAKLAAEVLGGYGGSAEPRLHLLSQWRILNPSLSLPWLLLYLWCVARAVKEPGRWRTALAGVAFGLLFYVYFYMWTAAGLGLILATLLDRRRWRTYVAVAAVGVLVGLPALWQGFEFRRAHGVEWMLRSDKFLPVGHFAELLVPRVSLVLLAAGVAWVVWSRRDFAYLAGLALAGLLLLNQQVVTGLQIENFHWNLVLGPALALLSLLLVVGLVRSGGDWPKWARGLAVGAVAAVVVTGVGLRVVEATRDGEATEIGQAVARYLSQTAGGETRFQPDNAVVAGEPYFVEAASILDNARPLDGYIVVLSATVADAEWDARVALNARLRGLSREEFAAEQSRWLDGANWGPWARGRSAAAREQKFRDRMNSWDAVEADPLAALDRFHVRYVALPAGCPAEHLRTGWVCLQYGPHWQLWERPEAAGARRASVD
jgi:hypothetical protein